MPDHNHPEVKAVMYHLQAAQPPWRKQNMSAHAFIDLEYFFIEEGYSKYIGDSLEFLKSTWHRRAKRQLLRKTVELRHTLKQLFEFMSERATAEAKYPAFYAHDIVIMYQDLVSDM